MEVISFHLGYYVTIHYFSDCLLYLCFCGNIHVIIQEDSQENPIQYLSSELTKRKGFFFAVPVLVCTLHVLLFVEEGQ